MKRVLWITALFLCVTLLGSSALAADKIVLKKYPDLKMGFLNVNFIKQWPLGVESAKKVIDFASEQGFSWIELRDPFATLTLAECKELATYAKQRDIEVAYAMNVGLLDPNFWEVFSRGLANAAVFEELVEFVFNRGDLYRSWRKLNFQPDLVFLSQGFDGGT